MAELVNAPASAIPVPTVEVASLYLDWDSKTIIVKLVKSDGSFQVENYNTQQGAGALLLALNKADLTVQSLHRHILAKLIADGRLQGTISGTPD